MKWDRAASWEKPAEKRVHLALPVTIVIPAYNRDRVLQGVIPTYLRQGCAELVVVDDGSDPPLRRVDSSGETVVTWIRLDQRMNQPAARMVGARAATQPWIFFGEDDAFLSEGCIAHLLQYLESGTYDMAATRWITVMDTPDQVKAIPPAERRIRSAAEVVDYRAIQLDCGSEPLQPVVVPWLHTPALMAREAVLRLGFDPGYRGNAYREETDFYLRASDAGLRLAFVPGPPVYHYKGPLNTSWGREVRRLWFTESWVLRNNLRFVRRNREALLRAGASARPLWDTLKLMALRARWYWRRLLIKLFRRSRRDTTLPL